MGFGFFFWGSEMSMRITVGEAGGRDSLGGAAVEENQESTEGVSSYRHPMDPLLVMSDSMTSLFRPRRQTSVMKWCDKILD